jgi:phosphoglycolate phosphatase
MALMPALAHAAPDVPKDKYPMLGERYRHHYALHHQDLSLFEGILPMLQTLRDKQHILTVATGKSRKGLDDALHQVELRGMFDGSRTADETAGKPNPRMLHELMAEFGVSPERTLMIGDTTHDLEMAHKAGCASVGVSYGAHGTSEFGRWQPLTVAHTVTELHDWLSEHG